MPLFLPFIGGVAIAQLFTLFPFSFALVSFTAMLFAVFRRRIAFAFFLGLGILYSFVSVRPLPEDLPAAELRLTGRFREPMPRIPEDYQHRTFLILLARDAATGSEIEDLGGAEVDMLVPFEPRYDRLYEVTFRPRERLRHNPGWSGPAGLSGAASSMREAGAAEDDPAGGIHRRRVALNSKIRDLMGRDSAGLVAAVTTGETTLLTDEVRTAFGKTGLAHILSISGTHFGLFSILLFGMFRAGINRLPDRQLLRLTLHASPSQAAAALCMPFVLLYLGISGGGTPALRSFIMISLFLLGLLLGRKGAWLNSLLLAAFILVLWDPAVLLTLSFQLSFLAVLFIGHATQKREEEDGPPKGFLERIKTSFRITLAATLGTAPIVAYHFHYFSFVSPLANLLAAPLIGFLLVPLSVFSAFIFILTGYYPLASVIGRVADYSIGLVNLLAGVPFADLAIPSFPIVLGILFYVGFLPYLVLGRRRVLLAIPLLPVVIYAILAFQRGPVLTATFLDVGQGDAAVVELPEGKTIVLDTGRSGREVISFLKCRGRRKIDILALSHVHPDHTGGAARLLRAFPVGEVWDNNLIEYPDGMIASVPHRGLGRGDVITHGNTVITALHPYPGFYISQGNRYAEENSSSLVLKIESDGGSLLFAGDLEEEAEEDLAHLGRFLKSDLLKVPHHGSRRSSDPWFLRKVSPSVAVISVGRDNHFGHPSAEALDLLSGSRLLRTDLDGAIKVTAGEGRLKVKTWRDFAFGKAKTWQEERANIRRLFETW